LSSIPSSSKQSIHAAIATETIVGGGLAHYTEDLDRALRSFADEDRIVEGAPFASPLRHAGMANNNRVVRLFRKSSLIKQSWRAFGRLRKREAWPKTKEWAEKWLTASEEVVAILPHVVINDEGKLDSYYAALANRDFVLVIHDLHALHFPDQWREVDVQLMRRRFKFLSQHAKRIIVHNEFTAQDVSEKLAVDRERISIVMLPSFFSEEAFPASSGSDEAQLAELGISPPYALWASSSTYVHKNHERLLQAWRLLVDQGHGIQLVCTGSKDPLWDHLSVLIRKLNLADHVRFTGIVNDAVMAAILRNAHLAICPTLFEGGGPGPAAEAMVAGIPLTASNIPQCRQLFNMRLDLCSFFDPYSPQAIADSVAEIVLDYESARHRADFARLEYPRMRTWQIAADQYWQAVEAAANARVSLHKL
jgi:glycosyltransferase involved in cell wall biosynthesis